MVGGDLKDLKGAEAWITILQEAFFFEKWNVGTDTSIVGHCIIGTDASIVGHSIVGTNASIVGHPFGMAAAGTSIIRPIQNANRVFINLPPYNPNASRDYNILKNYAVSIFNKIM